MATGCSNHRRDDFGWPLGSCPACRAYRAKMDAWYIDAVLAGNHDPDRIDDSAKRETEDGQ